MKITNPQKNTGCMMRVAGKRLVPGDEMETSVSDLTKHQCLILLHKHGAATLKIEFQNKAEEAEFLTKLGKQPAALAPKAKPQKPVEEAPLVKEKEKLTKPAPEADQKAVVLKT